MKNSFTTYQAINLLTAKSACYQRVSSSFQRLRQTKQKLSNNICEIMNNSQGGWYSYRSFSRDVITVQNQKLKIQQSFYPYQA